MRNARAHKLQWSDPTVHSSTVAQIDFRTVELPENRLLEKTIEKHHFLFKNLKQAW